MTFEIGKTYRISHSRKGIFSLRVTEVCDEWLSGIVVDGRAKAMMYYNEKGEGEPITMRKSFVHVLPDPNEGKSAKEIIQNAVNI